MEPRRKCLSSEVKPSLTPPYRKWMRIMIDTILLNAKLALYHLLLQKGNNELSEDEVTIMYLLSRDDGIQSLISKRIADG